MTLKDLKDLVERLERLDKPTQLSQITFARWSESAGRTIDYELSGCMPLGADGVTRIGLSQVVPS